MASENSLTKQFSFVEHIGIGKHSLMLYENPEQAQMIQFHIINQGLQKDVPHILLTSENIRTVENKMADDGIDIEGCKRKNLLHIWNSIDGNLENSMKSFLKIWGKIEKELNRPFMVVGGAISDVSTEKGVLAELNVERYVHRNLNDTFGALCCYDINNIEQNERERWISDLSQNHGETFLIR